MQRRLARRLKCADKKKCSFCKSRECDFFFSPWECRHIQKKKCKRLPVSTSINKSNVETVQRDLTSVIFKFSSKNHSLNYLFKRLLTSDRSSLILNPFRLLSAVSLNYYFQEKYSKESSTADKEPLV